MQALEKYFKDQLKKHNIKFRDTRSYPFMTDFIVFKNSDAWFIELKNHKKFCFNTWKKQQPNQYWFYKNCKKTYLILCKEANNFKNITIFSNNHIKNSTIKEFLTNFDKKDEKKLDKGF